MSTISARTEQSSFWERQFVGQPTLGQIVFDAAFGIVLPVVCLWFDPIVFRSSLGGPLVGRYTVVAGGAIGLGLLSLAAWMVVRRPPAFLAGLLTGGALFASLLGIFLLPFSIIGLFVLIGIL